MWLAWWRGGEVAGVNDELIGEKKSGLLEEILDVICWLWILFMLLTRCAKWWTTLIAWRSWTTISRGVFGVLVEVITPDTGHIMGVCQCEFITISPVAIFPSKTQIVDFYLNSCSLKSLLFARTINFSHQIRSSHAAPLNLEITKFKYSDFHNHNINNTQKKINFSIDNKPVLFSERKRSTQSTTKETHYSCPPGIILNACGSAWGVRGC